jgi:hypothetical protein
MTACRSCGAPILWAVTTGGKPIPLDAEPDAGGNVLMTGARVGTARGFAPEVRVEAGPPLFPDDSPRFMPHHATCPQADRWRKP